MHSSNLRPHSQMPGHPQTKSHTARLAHSSSLASVIARPEEHIAEAMFWVVTDAAEGDRPVSFGLWLLGWLVGDYVVYGGFFWLGGDDFWGNGWLDAWGGLLGCHDGDFG